MRKVGGRQSRTVDVMDARVVEILVEPRPVMPAALDDEGADGGEEKAVSGSIGSDGKQNRAVKRRMDARRALLFA